MIPPAYLAQALDGACGGRPTILVTSGCYSGIYRDTPALTTPDRIVPTAARADRPSFGCGTDDRYTYDDECFLDSLKRGAAWTVIAADISGCPPGANGRRASSPRSRNRPSAGTSPG